MATKKSEKGRDELATRLKKLMGLHWSFSRETKKKLDAVDSKDIGRLVTESIGGVGRRTKANAMGVLAARGGVTERRILSRVLARSDEEPELRAAAAIYLGRLPGRFSESRLIECLAEPKGMVRYNIIQALGCIGGAKALEALSKIRVGRDPYIRKQLIFAKTLISYRLGIDKHDIPFVEGVKRKAGADEDLIELAMTTANAREIGIALNRLQGSDYNIKVSPEKGFKVTAGRAEWILFLNKDSLSRKLILPAILKKKMITGLLTRKVPETNEYAVQYLVLTRPRKLALEIMVVRTDGEVFYSGRGSVSAGSLSFQISDIKRPGTAPTLVSGLLGPKNKVEFKVLIPFGRRKGKLQTTKAIRPHERA